MKFQMLYRIEDAGIFRGVTRIKNAEAVRRVNELKTIGKPVGSVNKWMKELCFRKEYVRDKKAPYTLRLWWVRE